MHLLTRILGALPRNMLVPAIVLLAGWYGGAKYGAPEYLVNSVDSVIEQGTTMVGGLLGGGEEEAADGGESEDI